MVGIYVNADAIARAGKALNEVGLVMDEKVLVPAINRTGQHVRAKIRPLLARITGLASMRVARTMSWEHATKANLSFVLSFKHRAPQITTGNFGAAVAKRGGKGVRHRAWGRTQIAEGAFMIGRAVVARKGKARLPLKQVFGPSIAREVERDERGRISGMVYRAAQDTLQRRVLHETDRQIKRVKRKYNL